MKRRMVFAALMLAGTSGSLEMAYANSRNGADEALETQALLSAKLSASEAAKAAEAKAGGRATSVNLDPGEAGKSSFYHVEVIGTDGRQQDLAVDAGSGEVTMMSGMEPRQKGGHENGDGENGQDDASNAE